jgi:hypothetical protein
MSSVTPLGAIHRSPNAVDLAILTVTRHDHTTMETCRHVEFIVVRHFPEDVQCVPYFQPQSSYTPSLAIILLAS